MLSIDEVAIRLMWKFSEAHSEEHRHKKWGLGDWAAATALFAASVITALNAALKEAPELAGRFPGILDSPFWSYGPLCLLVVFGCIVLFKNRSNPSQAQELFSSPAEQEKFRFGGKPRFQLLAQHFVVNVSAQLPYVEARFIVVNFLPRQISLAPSRMVIQINSAPALEAVPLLQEDFVVAGYEWNVVTFRRNLSDAECKNLPWREGRNGAVFELISRAKDDGNELSYRVSSMSIDGWVNVPPLKSE